MRIIPVFLAVFLCITPACADDLKLSWPVACTEGQDCWIVNHVDQDASPDARDFQCGHLTYNGHDGTDIAVRDFKSVQSGVDVLAAASGKVVRIRNDINDHHGTLTDLAAVKESKKECGNLVSLLHADKWVTEYCHMKKGSISVALGQMVTMGTKLGQVGQSGLAEFPHLHFSLRHNNVVKDPFTGTTVAGCSGKGAPLWKQLLPYAPVKIYAAGFSTEPPNEQSIVLNAASIETAGTNRPALLFWMALYGLEAGDKINMTVHGPDDRLFVQSEEIAQRRKIRYFLYTGKKNSASLARGTYRGAGTLARTLPDGTILKLRIEKSISIR